MGRAPCCDKANVKKGPWSPEEDAKLKSYIEQHGTGGNWIALPQKIGLKRCGKSCRLRWLNYLRPNIKHGGFSEEEDRIICSLYVSIGSRWSIIAAQLPGRTDNDIKNYWNTRLKKKLFGKQRKEQQQTTRRGSALKQMQMKRENTTHGAENSAMFSLNDPHNNIPYWPQLPVAPQYGNDNQAAIRKLLMPTANIMPSSDINPIENLSKFGAQFTEETLYNANAYGYLPVLQGQSSHMGELESYNMGYDDPRRVLCGLEFLCGDHEIANACRISADQSCEMGSLICPSNYEAMLQDLSTEEYANFDGLRVSENAQ